MTQTVLPPTSRLPPIKTLNEVPLGHLHEAIQYLQIVYNPEIHTSRRIDNNNNYGSSPAPKMTPTKGKKPIHDAELMIDKSVMESSEFESIRVDAFEQTYAVRWLTALIAQKTTLHDDNDNDYIKDHDHHDQNSAANLELLVQSAAALLAICAGAASAGTRMRMYAFCGVRVQLTDLALQNDDFGSVGAQTWGSACVLAEMIAEAPARFGLYGGATCGGPGTHHNDNASVFCHGDADVGGGQRRGEGAAAIRVLELGAGTGLVSLTIAKILETTPRTCGCCGDNSRRRAEIVASDFYPPVLENLRLNIQRNFASTERDRDQDSDSEAPSGHNLSISAHFLNWEKATDPARALESPFDVPFDEVFGADIVYELEHAAWINACLRQFLGLTGRFHLVIPLRGGFARESATIERVFPRVDDMHRVMEAGPTLCITQREDITCEEPDGKGEVEYVHYTIQWAVCGDRGDGR
jgi:Lysine methyltransferase